MADARRVASRQNILVTGPTGAGKTFVGCALAYAALRRGHTALYLRAPRLLGDRALERGADLIAMTPHGRGGPGRVLLGGGADAAVRHATCCVLLVRVPEETPAS